MTREAEIPTVHEARPARERVGPVEEPLAGKAARGSLTAGAPPIRPAGSLGA